MRRSGVIEFLQGQTTASSRSVLRSWLSAGRQAAPIGRPRRRPIRSLFSLTWESVQYCRRIGEFFYNISKKNPNEGTE